MSPEFYDEKNVHPVILRNYVAATSGFNKIEKEQSFYLRVNTKISVKTQTIIDLSIKLM
ncbi:hypothetical protein VB735_20760 [Halotia wernerae UHCC 0503]|nr:hypothetical protein [Halotia wernerae UHCC 0503]